jgi:hypothetical protein
MSVFAPSGPAPQSSVAIVGPSVPTVENVTASLASTEYQYLLPAGTKRFKIQTRGVTTLQLAFASGESATKYLTVPAGACYEEDNVSLASGLLLFFQCSRDSSVIEILTWL